MIALPRISNMSNRAVNCQLYDDKICGEFLDDVQDNNDSLAQQIIDIILININNE